jgi:hypothetical protein
MGTRSTIALEFADGTVEQVYCHWDGYLDHNGKILQEHYSDPFKLRELMDLGGLSSLRPNIGVKHAFSALGLPEAEREAFEAKHADSCTFYGRDRGEDVAKEKYKDIKDYRENVYGEEYDYILCQREGKAQWFVRSYATEGNWVALDVAFEQQTQAEEN